MTLVKLTRDDVVDMLINDGMSVARAQDAADRVLAEMIKARQEAASHDKD